MGLDVALLDTKLGAPEEEGSLVTSGSCVRGADASQELLLVSTNNGARMPLAPECRTLVV